MHIFLEGFLLQASLILALGAQNIFVLESGLKKQRHLLVAFVCSLCDAILILIGVAGAASVFVQVPVLKIGFGILGVLFLLFYGVKKLREGFRPAFVEEAHAETSSSLKKVILLSLGFSLLNPHVYLDTVILIGGYSAKFAELGSRIQFGAGASFFSVLWFFGLAIFAYSCRKLLNNPRGMQIVSLLSGIILIALSYKLGFDVYGWILSI
jgi:L-lysine exporter family protein LysE/ArgO